MGWRMIAGSSVFLATIGVFLPLMPTTPFLLMAAWAAGKGDPALYERLHCHSVWGPPLRAWREQRAIAVWAKVAAILSLSVSWFFLWGFGAGQPVLLAMFIFFCCIAAFILTRPSPRTEI